MISLFVMMEFFNNQMLASYVPFLIELEVIVRSLVLMVFENDLIIFL